jgi:hypothetical protein
MILLLLLRKYQEFKTHNKIDSYINRFHNSLMNPIYEVDIDFDAASAAWAANKIRRGASYAYRCTAIRKNGKQCTRPALSRPRADILCVSHTKYRPAATILSNKSPVNTK